MDSKDDNGDTYWAELEVATQQKIARELAIANLCCLLSGTRTSYQKVNDKIGKQDCESRKGDSGDQGNSIQELDDLCRRKAILELLIPQLERSIRDLITSGEVKCEVCGKPMDFGRAELGYRVCIPCKTKPFIKTKVPRKR